MHAEINSEVTSDREPTRSIQGSSASGSAAFWHFFIGHRGTLLRFAMSRMNGNLEEAEDALSSAAINAARSLERGGRAIENPTAWFFRVLGNCCNDIYRERIRSDRALGGLRPEQRSYLGIDGHNIKTPEDNAQTNESHAKIAKIMTDMPAPLGETLRRRVFDNQAYIVIADEMKVSTALARKRVQLARDIIREKFDQTHK